MSEQTNAATQSRVRIRGTRDGIGLSLPIHLDVEQLLEQAAEAIDTSRDFLGSTNVVIEYGERKPEQRELERLLTVLLDRGVHAQSISVARPEHRAILREWGIQSVNIESRARPPRKTASTAVDERSALYVKRTLRSGASIHADGDIVILGDVNPGAEVSATGDVIVWGAVRGTVHAGSSGDDSTRICALLLQPTQLRIGSHVERPPDGKGQAAEGPQSAYIEDAMIVVEPWRGLERRGRSG
jgi:septum site-determining protein MinC